MKKIIIGVILTAVNAFPAFAVDIKSTPVLDLVEVQVERNDAEIFYRVLPVKVVSVPGNIEPITSKGTNAIFLTKTVTHPKYTGKIVESTGTLECAESYRNFDPNIVDVACHAFLYAYSNSSSTGISLLKGPLKGKSMAQALYDNILKEGVKEYQIRVKSGALAYKGVNLMSQDKKFAIQCQKQFFNAGDFGLEVAGGSKFSGIYCAMRFFR